MIDRLSARLVLSVGGAAAVLVTACTSATGSGATAMVAVGVAADGVAAIQDAGDEVRLLRRPSVSASHVVFEYANDIWVGSRDGGEARRLTTFEGAETWPHLSPDGTMVAFSGQYDGNTDVYVVPIEGGSPRRVTWHPGADVAEGWTPDGRAIVFGSARDTAPVGRYSRFWTIGLDDAMPEPLPLPRVYQGKFDGDQSHFVYRENEPWDIEWRNYRGGQAKPIWLCDMATLEVETLPWDGSNDSDPVFLGGKVYFLSDRDLAVNVYEFDPATKALRQLTQFTEYDAKNLEAGGGVLVYEHGGRIRRLDPVTGSEDALAFTLRGDFPWARPHWQDVGSSIADVRLSPSGARVVVEARGEIFTLPTEHGTWRNLSKDSGAADRSPAWSPDGRHVAWFSDASGEYQLMIGTQDGLESARVIDIPDPTFFYTPRWSPDGDHILFTDEGRTIWVAEVETGAITRVDQDAYATPVSRSDPQWSPDGTWIAYDRVLDSKMRVVMLYSVADGTTHQITDGMADAYSPVFDRSGDHLFMLASNDRGLQTGWLDLSSFGERSTASLYAVLLRSDVANPLAPRSDEETEKADEDADGDGDGDADADADAEATAAEDSDGETGADTGDGADASEDGAAAEDGDDATDGDTDADADADDTPSIELDGIERRIVALPMAPRNYLDLEAGSDGVVFVLEATDGPPGTRVHRFSAADREASEFMSGAQSISVSHDGSKLVYRAGGTIGVVPTAGAASVGQGRVNTSGLRLWLDPAAEWAQIYEEAWRFHRDYFYVPNLHGADWDAVKTRYQPLVGHIRHRSDLSHLIDIVGGEIAVGHSFVGGGDVPSVDRVPGGLLGADVAVADGRFRIERILLGEPWNPTLRAPLGEPGVDVAEGDYLLAVEGLELDADTMNLYQAFEGTAGRPVRLHVNDAPTMEGARVVTVVPIASEALLRSRTWQEDNRKKVDELSDGKLAYVWLPDTGGGGYTNFNRYFFPQADRVGIVVDERFNSGGFAANYVVDILAREVRGFFNNPVGDRTPFPNPQAVIRGPKVMIVNESAGSGGDLMPWLFRDQGVGPLIGTRTWGGLVGIWGTPNLIDGGRVTVPRGGFYTNEGRWAVENEGVAPDIEVEQFPAGCVDGGDPQLEAAVAEALRLLEENGAAPIVPEPVGPVRAVRPGAGG